MRGMELTRVYLYRVCAAVVPLANEPRSLCVTVAFYTKSLFFTRQSISMWVYVLAPNQTR